MKEENKMGLTERLNKKRKSLQDQMKRGLEVTRQMHDEKARRKAKKFLDMKPGAVKAIRHGLATKANPIDVMKAEYDRRKYEREQKQKRKGGENEA